MDEIAVLCVFMFTYIDNKKTKHFGQNGIEDFPIQSTLNFFVRAHI
jgi:hypothetical protein